MLGGKGVARVKVARGRRRDHGFGGVMATKRVYAHFLGWARCNYVYMVMPPGRRPKSVENRTIAAP